MTSMFLPLGLIASFIIAWAIPEAGSLLKEIGLIPWMIVTIFLVNGYQTNLSELPRDRSFVYTLTLAAIISLLISPLIGLGVSELLILPTGIALGIIVTATVPPTLSTCIVMTQLTNGRATWALVMTVILNIAGVFTIPFMLGLTVQGDQLSIDPWPLLQKLMLLVLLPFILGSLAKQVATIDPKHVFLQYLPSSCVILTVWMALSDSSEVFQQLTVAVLSKIAIATLLLHFGLMLLALLASKLINLPAEERLAMLFTTSQKTLPVAVSVLAALNMPIGEAVLTCVLFHFLMLFIDSLLVPKLRIKAE